MKLQHAAKIAIKSAKIAGKNLMTQFGNVKSRTKTDGSLITSADSISNRLIKTEILTADPSADFLSEENTELRLKNKYGRLWVIDPLDGTTNYVNGLPMWAISIALIDNLDILIGVIHLPLLKVTILAIKGKGTFRNGTKVSVKHPIGNQFKDIFTFCSWRSNNFASNLEGNIRAFGSTAYNFAQFASGHTLGGWELFPRIWDIGAGILIVREAGGFIGDLKGNDIYEKIKKTRKLHKDVLPCIYATSESLYFRMLNDYIKTSLVR